MKKLFTLALTTLLLASNVTAQETGKWTLNTRAWSTNYFTSIILGAAKSGINSFALKGNEKDSLLFNRIVPSPDLVFPIGMGKRGFADATNIYGPYHRAFSNPFKHIGDYAIGAEMSFHPSTLGFYAGAYFKSQEIVFKSTKDNLRGFYIQPRCGLLLGSAKKSFEAGVFYDIVTGCGGTIQDTDKNRLKGGLGLDFAFTSFTGNKSKTTLQFSMPLHNFINTNYPGQAGYKRKVGYIMLTQRICL